MSDTVPRGRLAVHGHFYQPERRDPWTLTVPTDPSATPFHDWNARITAECYAPNAELGSFSRISFDVGPSLAAWLAEHAPDVERRIHAADHGNAMASGFHHAILPLASPRDRRTEIAWGLRDFELRTGRRARGFWLPETAVDLPTLRLLAEAGIDCVILAPWQVSTPVDTRRPYRVDLGAGRDIIVAIFDGALSAAVSFHPPATSNAEAFIRDSVLSRVAAAPPIGPRSPEPPEGEGTDRFVPLVLIATDGELYGHHQPFRDLFLARLVNPPADGPDQGVAIVDLATELFGADRRSLPRVELAERTSWSCHEGVLRWSTGCACVPDGSWKAPLRSALERLAIALDRLTAEHIGGLGRPATSPIDVWALRDAYVEVAAGFETRDDFTARIIGTVPVVDVPAVLDLLEAQRWRLAMFASDGFYWEDPCRVETRHILRSAARATRLVADVTGISLEGPLLEDLTRVKSPSRGVDGRTIYLEALEEVGQPLHHPG